MITELFRRRTPEYVLQARRGRLKRFPSNARRRGTLVRARILLADDHKGMRDRAARLLEPEFEVVGAVGDGSALLEAANRTKPDVCVMDISMPVVNGIQAATRLKTCSDIHNHRVWSSSLLPPAVILIFLFQILRLDRSEHLFYLLLKGCLA